MVIFYKFSGNLYANITNRCPCSCKFCIRKNGDGVGDSGGLWLEREPTIEEIKTAFDETDKKGIAELVFCGYGEPMARAGTLMETAKYVKEKSGMKIRVNTNGLISLMDPDFDVSSMKGVIDAVSVSLNACDAEKYLEITRPKYGINSYAAMLDFAENAKKYVNEVSFTIVDCGLSEEEKEKCAQIAEKMNIPLRIRHYVTDNESYT